MRDRNAIPYLKYSLELHSCVTSLKKFELDLLSFLLTNLSPDLLSDIEMTLEESAGLLSHNELVKKIAEIKEEWRKKTEK